MAAEFKPNDGEQLKSSAPEAENATPATMTTDSNPFMSVKAQSFKPTAFVPSPNKSASVLSFASNQFSPMKIPNFAQASQMQPQGPISFNPTGIREFSKERNPGGPVSSRSGGSIEALNEGSGTPTPASSNPFRQPLQQKIKSAAFTGSFGARAHDTLTSSSSFAFQPLYNSKPFGAASGSSSMQSQNSF